MSNTHDYTFTRIYKGVNVPGGQAIIETIGPVDPTVEIMLRSIELISLVEPPDVGLKMDVRIKRPGFTPPPSTAKMGTPQEEFDIGRCLFRPERGELEYAIGPGNGLWIQINKTTNPVNTNQMRLRIEYRVAFRGRSLIDPSYGLDTFGWTASPAMTSTPSYTVGVDGILSEDRIP